MKSARLLPLFIALAATAPSLLAQVFPLSENTWSNPDFVKRFLGSYGFNTEVNPSITTEERAIFEKIVPLVSTQPALAISELTTALAANPAASPAMVYTLANVYFQTGDIPAAETRYKEAIARFPNFLRAYKNLGVLYVQTGKYADALPLLIKTIELGGQGADVYGLLAYCYLSTGNSVAALRSYEQALFFEPKSRDWRMGRVQALMNIGRQDDAIAAIDDLIKEFPTQTELLMLQSNAFIAKNDPHSAAATLEIVRAAGKADANSLTLLGDIYLNFNQADLALGLYQEALGTKSLGKDRVLRVARRLATVNAWTQLDAYIATLDSTSGSTNYTDAEQIDLLNLKAQSDLAQNRNEAAGAKLAEVVQRDPLNGRALLLLANYYWNTGEIARAELHYERAAKVEAVAPEAMIQHARMLVAQRDFQKAVSLLERAQAIRPVAYIGQYMEKVAAASRASGR